MNEPLPGNYVALFFDDATNYELGGINFGTHMTMPLLFDVEDSNFWKDTPFVIAHEG